MITPYLAAGYLFAMQVSGPMDRLRLFLRNSDFLAVQVTTVVNGAPPSLVAEYEWHKSGVRQRLKIKLGTETREFIQDPEMVMTINHTAKTYQEYGRVPIFVNPPADDPLILFSYPAPLVIPAITSATAGTWKEGARTTKAGVPVDEATLTMVSEAGNATFQFFVDDSGRLISLVSNRPTPAGNERIDQTFSNYRLGDTGQSKISAQLPVGYMPQAILLPSDTVMAGEQAEMGTWIDARSGKATDMGAWQSDRPFVILFTAADCEVSLAAEPSFRKLREALRRDRIELIEVVLGSEKGDLRTKDGSRPVFWDRDGKIEQAYGIHHTPYLLAVDSKRVIRGGWTGFGNGEEKRMIETMTGLFRAPKGLE